MERIMIKLIWPFFFLCIFSCSEKERYFESYNSTEELVKSLGPNQIISWMVRLPEGTSYRMENGFVKINLPVGYELLGYLSYTNQLITISGFTCTCADGSSRLCKPITAGDYVGCVTYQDNPCQRCIGTYSTFLSLQEFDMIYLIHNQEKVNPLAKALVGLARIQPIFYPAELKELPMIDEKDLNSREFATAMQEIQDYAFPNGIENAEGGNIPLGTSLVAWKFNNRKFYLLAPSNLVEPGMIEVLPLFSKLTAQNFNSKGELEVAGEVYCSGSCPEGKCRLRSAYMGKVKFCDGCNSGCTIHFSEK
ncbi:MAG TPA: hypothetical protein VLH61_09730 [Bacteroidales bacterium]|nr:hypothetical protein [Bacteroidales bacterium]